MCYWYFKVVTITKAFHKNLKEPNRKPNKILVDKHNKYSNTYHRTIKMKPVDVKPSTYINSSKEINDEDPKFKFGDINRRSKYKNNLPKAIFQIGLKMLPWLKKLKRPCRGNMLLVIKKANKLLELFTKKNCKK